MSALDASFNVADAHLSALDASFNVADAHLSAIDLSLNAPITKIATTVIANPGAGSMYFDETTNKLYVYNSTNSVWTSATLV